MTSLKKTVYKLIAITFSFLSQSVVSIVLSSLILGSGGLLLFSESIRTVVIDTIQKPQPLWVTIVLVLIVIVYTYLKTRSLQPPIRKPLKIK